MKSVVGRFTRDEASRIVWGFALLLLVVAVVLSFLWESRDLRSARTDAQNRAVSYVTGALDGVLQTTPLSSPLDGVEAGHLGAEVRRLILSDGRVSRVRIFSLDGRELFSTDRGRAVLPSDVIREAGAIPTTVTSGSGPSGQLQTFAAIREAGITTGIAEIDQRENLVLGPVRERWSAIRIGSVPFALLLLTLWLLSLRPPLARIGFGVRLYPESVPEGQALTATDRLREVESILSEATERVGRAEARVQDSEERRRRLEGDLQRALSGAGSAPSSRAPAKPKLAVAPPPKLPLSVPTRETQNPKPLPAAAPKAEKPAAAAGPPIPVSKAPAEDRRPSGESVTSPSVPKKPAAAETTGARREAQHARVESPAVGSEAPRPATQTPQPAPKPPPLSTIPPLSAAETPRAPTPSQPPTPGEDVPQVIEQVIEVPEADDVPTEAGEEKDDEKPSPDESALDVLIRMVEPLDEPSGPPPADSGALREALARTAARKKPGARRASHG